MLNQIIRTISALLVAATVAFAVTAAPAANDDVAKQVPVLVKAETAAVTGSRCSQQAWPDYETKCQFDVRRAGGDARSVRVLALR